MVFAPSVPVAALSLRGSDRRPPRGSMRANIRPAGPNQVLRVAQRDVGTQPRECHAGRKGKHDKGSKQAIRLRIFRRRRLVEYGQHDEIFLFE